MARMGNDFFVVKLLKDAGVNIPDNITRIVLDINTNDYIKIYYETLAETKAVEAIFSPPGIRNLPLRPLHDDGNSQS